MLNIFLLFVPKALACWLCFRIYLGLLGYNLQMTMEIETNKDFWQRDPDTLWVKFSACSFEIFFIKFFLG